MTTRLQPLGFGRISSLNSEQAAAYEREVVDRLHGRKIKHSVMGDFIRKDPQLKWEHFSPRTVGDRFLRRPIQTGIYPDSQHPNTQATYVPARNGGGYFVTNDNKPGGHQDFDILKKFFKERLPIREATAQWHLLQGRDITTEIGPNQLGEFDYAVKQFLLAPYRAQLNRIEATEAHKERLKQIKELTPIDSAAFIKFRERMIIDDKRSNQNFAAMFPNSSLYSKSGQLTDGQRQRHRGLEMTWLMHELDLYERSRRPNKQAVYRDFLEAEAKKPDPESFPFEKVPPIPKPTKAELMKQQPNGNGFLSRKLLHVDEQGVPVLTHDDEDRLVSQTMSTFIELRTAGILADYKNQPLSHN